LETARKKRQNVTCNFLSVRHINDRKDVNSTLKKSLNYSHISFIYVSETKKLLHHAILVLRVFTAVICVLPYVLNLTLLPAVSCGHRKFCVFQHACGYRPTCSEEGRQTGRNPADVRAFLISSLNREGLTVKLCLITVAAENKILTFPIPKDQQMFYLSPVINHSKILPEALLHLTNRAYTCSCKWSAPAFLTPRDIKYIKYCIVCPIACTYTKYYIMFRSTFRHHVDESANVSQSRLFHG
jgi:hypothetical protein